jgi:hypothetical protein
MPSLESNECKLVRTTAAWAQNAGSTNAAAQSSRMSRGKTGFLPDTGLAMAQVLFPLWSVVN